MPAFFMISGYTLLSKENVSASYSFGKIVALIRIVLLWDVVKYVLYFLLSLRYKNTGIWLLEGFTKDFFRGLIQDGTHWHFWYLGTLMIIYLCLPFLNKICKVNRNLIAIWAVLFVVSGALQILSYSKGYSVQRTVIQTFRLWTAFQYLLLGGIISRYKDSIKISKNILAISYAAITFTWIGIQCFIINNEIGEVWAECYYDDFIAIIWNAILFILILKIGISEKFNIGINKLAPLTFGVYIVHPLILDIMSRYIKVQGTLTAVGQYFILALVSFVATAFLKKFASKLVKL